MSRRYPALDLISPTAPSEERLAQIVADLQDAHLTAVEERETSTRLFFLSSEARDRAAAELRTEPDLAVETVDVSDEDWAARSQASLTPVKVGRIIVAPPWAAVRDAEDLLVVIQPSMGFGTGHHPSTRLCLRLLQECRLDDAAVLDLGTGSGVLAIAARRLGAARVLAIDNDPDALTSARENVALNGVEKFVSLEQTDLGAPQAPPLDHARRAFDLVLANLSAAVLLRYTRELQARVAAGGVLVAGGFGVSDEADVQQAFARAGLVACVRAEEDGWVALRVTSPRSSRAR